MSILPPLTIFDVETTGLDPRRGHRIVEIAAVRVENGIILEESAFAMYVNPERAIPWETQQINHITESDVASAQTIMSVLPQFLSFAEGSKLVAHNAAFDMGFLNVEKEFCWGYIDLPECFCTMRMSQSLFPTAFRHNLDAVSQRLALTAPVSRHRALPDVLLTANALLKMVEIGNITSLDALRRHASITPKGALFAQAA